MAFLGLIGLTLAFVGIVASVILLGWGQLRSTKAERAGREDDLSVTFAWAGRIAASLSTLGLTVAVVVLGVAFLTGDYTIQYVLNNHSSATGPLAWLYKLSGIWAGREGSLLFWAWLIAVFNFLISRRESDELRKLDSMALLVSQLVLLSFVAVLLFSEDNMPFVLTDAKYLENGMLTAAGQVLGMNSLLEHWAMAIHPPTLFVGYAGLTVPFAYAMAALITNDTSARWVERSTRYVLFSWLLLSIGIGLGSVWAYVVLGWGGYWGWDPVENASLLPWLMGVALFHSFMVVRQRGAFKGWAILCAALTFSFVIVGTFISRSGLVQSVHAFEGDPVSLVLFAGLIVLSVLAAIVGLALRRKSFFPKEGVAATGAMAGEGSDAGDDDASAEAEESLFSKEGLFYLNNLIMVLATFLLAYMTISSALPTWMPLGGQSLSAGSYNAIARPLSMLYLLLIAVGPIAAWGRTDRADFLAKVKLPAFAGLVVFVALMAFFFTNLLPVYDASIAAGGSVAAGFLEQGPAWWYNGLALFGFAVASFTFASGLALLIRNFRTRGKRLTALGGAVSHTAMAIILVGLIGSSMYVTESSGYLPYDADKDTCSETYVVKDYELTFTGSSITQLENLDVVYQTEFDVTKSGTYVGHVNPSVQLDVMTQQQKLNASVISLPGEDLFVVYRGVSADGAGLSLLVMVNPLILLVWGGFVLLMIGGGLAFLGRRPRKEPRVDA